MKHFSREEQAALEGRRQNVILDVADKELYSLGWHNNNSRHSESTLLASTLRVQPSDIDSKATMVAPYDMEKSMENTFRWLDDDNDLDLKLDDYHLHLAKTITASPGSTRKPSYRRGSSLNSMKVARVSTSSIKLPISQVPSPLPSPSLPTSHQRTRSRPNSGHFRWTRRPSAPAIPVIDPGAKHYRDPEARLKLRVYLASPQKFDEAIEFGFPSLANKENPNALRAKTAGSGGRSNKHNASSEHSFLNDDGGSLWESGRGDVDEVSLPDADSTATPLDAMFKPAHRPFTTTNSDPPESLGLSRPHSKPRLPNSSATALAGGREMTLRMTLTRPDLRDDETALYDWHDGSDKDDPLALEELPLGPPGATGMMGPFGGADGWGAPRDGGVMRRMWRRISGRS